MVTVIYVLYTVYTYIQCHTLVIVACSHMQGESCEILLVAQYAYKLGNIETYTCTCIWVQKIAY